MRFDCTYIFGWKPANVGMRLTLSRDWEDALSKSDTKWGEFRDWGGLLTPVLGEDDLRLAQHLIKADGSVPGAGTPNSKFLQMVHVWVSIQAPLSFWIEFDTYRHTVKNSTSRMHTLMKYPIDESLFEVNPITGRVSSGGDLARLEGLRQQYLQTRSKSDWYELLYALPPSWLQTRMVNMNYQTIRSMVQWRCNHKQTTWSGVDSSDSFLRWASNLPYAREFLGVV